MAGRNKGVCHSCREVGHYFSECPKKRHCPFCGRGYLKRFVVEKESKNKGKLFDCCSLKCGYYVFLEEGESSGSCVESESVGVPIPALQHAADIDMEEFSALFGALARISDERDVEISVNVTIRKSKDNFDDKGRGKKPV